MNKPITREYEESLSTIRKGILSLKASGCDGFEGLLRIVLTKLTDIPFRLAASGLQGGMDGDAVMPEDAICFEAKRYSNEIHRNEVLVKIADLARKKDLPDRLWVLGATTEVSSQLAAAVKEDGDRNAISTIILDWVVAPLPLLAIAIVAANDSAIDFIYKNHQRDEGQNKLTRSKLKAAFLSIAFHPEFESNLNRLKSNLNNSKLALKRAIDLNTEWRKQTFSSKRYSRERLGQGLAIIDDLSFPLMRTELQESIKREIQVCKDVILLGDEGHGKSWLAAQLCLAAEGISLFVSAELLDSISPDNIDDFLIRTLIKQTGEVIDDNILLRWKHRIEAWKITPPLASLLVVIDGLNQRQNLRWDQLLNSIQSRLEEIGGRMIVTSRSHFWQRTVSHGLAFSPTIIKITEWSPSERDELLTYYGISNSWLDRQTLTTLQNPRLLSVAVDIIPHKEANAWKGLTTDRLLMEHLRASQLEKFENETFVNLTHRLSEHATEVLERVQFSPNKLPQNFRADSNAVIETRFFRPLPGPTGQYELRSEGLTLALGFTLVDQLWQTFLNHKDLVKRIRELVEPIKAMDRTADVVFASLLICALDETRFDRSIYSVLLDAFTNIQNIDDSRFEEFIEIIRYQPEEFFVVLKELCLEKNQRINHDWFVNAAFEIAKSEKGWHAAAIAIHQWLHCYNKDPIEQASYYYNKSDYEYEKQIEEKKSEIEKTLSSLSNFEKKLLDTMTEISGEPMELFTIALRLLAGRSLVDFADSFVAMGLAFSLDSNINFARKEFQQLTTFNQVNRPETRNAFLKAIIPLQTEDTSLGGKWTVVRMLYATGEESDAGKAMILAEKLRKDVHQFEFPPSKEWEKVNVANPDILCPSDIDEAIQLFKNLDPNKMLQTMNLGQEDHSFNEYLPIICRFSPNIAIEKVRDILSGLITRTGLPLRQVTLNSEEHLPLVQPDLAMKMLHRTETENIFHTLPLHEQLICQRFIFYYAAAQISASKQLEYMTERACGQDFLLSAIPSIKYQTAEEIIPVISEALRINNEDAIYGSLIAALYGHARMENSLEEIILQCSHSKHSKTLSTVFQLAIKNNIKSVRQTLFNSKWKATDTSEKTYEKWFGSMLLLESCVLDGISFDDIQDRIGQDCLFLSFSKLGLLYTTSQMEFLVQKLRNGVMEICKLQTPAVNFRLSKSEQIEFPLVSFEEKTPRNERFPKNNGLEEWINTRYDFTEKRNKLNSMAKGFLKEINKSDARVLIQEISIENLRSLAMKTPTLLDELIVFLDSVDNAKILWLKNLMFAVASLISRENPNKSISLFNSASMLQDSIIQDLGDDLTIEHQAIWGSAATVQMEAVWRKRLLSSKNDAVLAREILAAERFGASDFINSLIIELISSDNSLSKAYGITIAGYSTQSAVFHQTINIHLTSNGICAQAAKHALSEHERNQYARIWISNMWSAPTAEEFWRCLTIAKTAIDARVAETPTFDNKWPQYAPVFYKVRKTAIRNRNKEREKRLIGQEVPESIFITSF